MRLGAFIAAYAAQAVASASAPPNSAYIYTIDQAIHASSTQFIDADLASSILARRRGLTESRYLNTADESILDDLNTFGGWQQPMFGEGAGEAPGKLFIRITGFDEGFSKLGDQLPNLLVEEPTTALRDDFKAMKGDRKGHCEYAVPPSINAPNSKGVEVIFTYPLEDEPSCLPPSDIPNIPVILSLNSVLPTSPSSLSKAIGPLTRILRHLAATQNVESTLLILPSKLTKSPSTHAHHARSVPEETPLDLPLHPSPSPVYYSSESSNATNATKPLPSVIPACFSSLDACTNTTNNCSSHGGCYRAHNNCFKCKCGSTVLREYDDGSKQSVAWGGAACQKEDVSVQFVLFASLGVALVTIVAGGVGMLYSMGSGELPKVLSAGVGGSRPSK